MAKFSGKIGFSVQSEEAYETGIWSPSITEKHYYGDILDENFKWQEDSSKVIDDLNISNRISIVANSFAINNIGSMLYVVLYGVKWKIMTAQVKAPRIILYLGGIYNG